MINRVVKPSAVKPTAGAKALPRVPVAGIIGGIAPLVAVAPAFADEVDTSVDSVVSYIQAAGGALKTAGAVFSSGIEVAKQGYEVAAPVIQQGIDFATPYANQAASAAASAATAAAPAFNNAISSSGLPVQETIDTIASTTSTVSTTAAPFISQASVFVSTADPVLLAGIGLGFAVFLVAVPSMLDSLKGYAGELTAASAQDLIVNSGALLVDIRTDSEKDAAGLPDLPSSANNKVFEVEYAATADRKLRGALKNAGGLEVQVTALQIAALKKVSKGSTIVLMDKNGGVAFSVAKELASKGFGKVYVLTGGFSGWTSSKLQIKPAASTSGFSGSSISTTFTRKALPAGK